MQTSNDIYKVVAKKCNEATSGVKVLCALEFICCKTEQNV